MKARQRGIIRPFRIHLPRPFHATVLRTVRNKYQSVVACAGKNNSFVNLLAVDHCRRAVFRVSLPLPPPDGPPPLGLGQFRGSTRFLAVTRAGNGTRRPQEIDR